MQNRLNIDAIAKEAATECARASAVPARLTAFETIIINALRRAVESSATKLAAETANSLQESLWREELIAARQERDTSDAELAVARALLKSLEWYSVDSLGWNHCPSCNAKRHPDEKHKADCPLDAALNERKPQ